jgi:thiamine-phosphate pyrophosphorylase
MVGAGGIKTRHNALVVGEWQPDYVFFGKVDGDIRDEAHPRNIELAQWWAALVEIPCVVMGGRSLASVVDVARSGAEFVALNSAIFANDGGLFPGHAVMEANRLLDESAPRFGDV